MELAKKVARETLWGSTFDWELCQMSMLRTSMGKEEHCEGSQKYGWYFAEYQYIQPDARPFKRVGLWSYM